MCPPYQVVQLNSGHALVYARDDFQGDGSSVDMLGIEAITKSRDTSSDLVELYAFLASIWRGSNLSVLGSNSVAREVEGGEWG